MDFRGTGVLENNKVWVSLENHCFGIMYKMNVVFLCLVFLWGLSQ